MGKEVDGMTELKPCPFCGRKVAFVDYVFHKERPYYQHYAQVICAACQASVGSTGFSNTKEEAERKAIKAWNMRIEDNK